MHWTDPKNYSKYLLGYYGMCLRSDPLCSDYIFCLETARKFWIAVFREKENQEKLKEILDTLENKAQNMGSVWGEWKNYVFCMLNSPQKIPKENPNNPGVENLETKLIFTYFGDGSCIRIKSIIAILKEDGLPESKFRVLLEAGHSILISKQDREHLNILLELSNGGLPKD